MRVFGTWKILTSSVVFNPKDRGAYLQFELERVKHRQTMLLGFTW